MNEKNTLESLFGELKGSFDREQPEPGHRERFLERLEAKGAGPVTQSRRNWWRPLSIAASVALLITASVFMMRPEESLQQQVARISPEASQTSFYFANLVEQQVRELERENSPETKPLIDATLRQLQQLEADYQRMEQDLLDGGNSKLILSAMITNFQTRIDLLQDVMQQIEQIKQFKNNTNATNTI